MEFRGVLKNYILHRKHSPNLGHSSRNGRAQFEVLVLFFLAAGSENLERTNIQPRNLLNSLFDLRRFGFVCVCLCWLPCGTFISPMFSLFRLCFVFAVSSTPFRLRVRLENHPQIAIIYKNPKNTLSPCLVDNYSKFGKPHHLISISDFWTRSRPSFLETSLQSPPMNHTRASAPMFSGSHSSR